MKSILTVLVVFCFIGQANGQLKIGVNAAIPAGDVSDFYSLSAGADIYYMFGESKDALLKFGGTTGFINYFGDDLDIGGSIEDAQFIPLAFVGRITFLSTLTFGADLGYGIGINDGNDGGAYGRAVFGLDLGNTIEVNAFYHLVIMDELNFGSAGLGLLFVF